MAKNYYKASDVYPDFVSAIATQIGKGVKNCEEGKWDEGVIRIHTNHNSYEVRLTDPDQYQVEEGCEEFPEGCVLLAGSTCACELDDAGMVGNWMDYTNSEEWMAEQLLSYINEFEGPKNYDWIDEALLDRPRYGKPNTIWVERGDEIL